MSKKFDIDIKLNLDTGELESTQKMLKELVDTDDPDIEVHANDSEIKTAKKEFDDLNGEKAEAEVHVDDSEIKNAKKELDDLQKQLSSNMNSTGNAVNGLVAGLAGKGIWDIVYGTSAKAETNKVLIKNMGDTTEAYDKLYDKIDTTTDNSLISMQQLIPAMNGIKSATGATAKEIDTVTPGVANFGQYVYAMTGSSAKAEQAMFDLSKGIKGAYASLDQYGITEDALMRTGLWSGKEDDIEGYIAAVNEVTGGTEELMDTATGMEALMGKSFSRAGKKIGQTVLPAVKQLLGGFNDLDAATDGWLSTAILIGGGVGSSVVSGLSAINQAKQGYDALKGSVQTVTSAFGAARDAITILRNAESVSAGIKAVLAAATTGESVAEGLSAGAKSAAVAPTTALSIAENSLLLPILLVTAAIIALVAILWYLYNNNETVRQSIDGLVAQFQQFIGVIINVAQQIYSFVATAITQVWQWVTGTTNGVNNLVNLVMSILFPFPTMIFTVLNRVLPFIINAVTSWANNASKGASNLVNKVSSTLSGLPSRISSALNGVTNALTRPFTNAWGQIQGTISKIQNGIGSVTSWFSGFEGYEGFGGGSVGYEGFNSTLNSTLASSNSNNSATINNNFNINGIIEEEASQFIVSSVNEHIKKQNLIRGV